ncbi:MAG: glycoside hydrolase family 2 protein [Thermoguttaceae bacterium]
MLKKFVIGLAVLACFGKTFAADDVAAWKIAGDKIVTRFAKDVDPAAPLPEYPRPQMVRGDWKNLNGLWDYAITAKDAAQPTNWDGKILVPYPIESALSGVGKTVGSDKRLWYRRTFTVPKEWSGKTILLHFGAVDWETTVIVNGEKVGDVHTGGYTPFTFGSDAKSPGVAAFKVGEENEIVVSVWDPTSDSYQPRGKQINNPHGIWYTPVTGIWQTVWLEAVPKQFVSNFKLTPSLKDGTLQIEAQCIGSPEATRTNAQNASLRNRRNNAGNAAGRANSVNNANGANGAVLKAIATFKNESRTEEKTGSGVSVRASAVASQSAVATPLAFTEGEVAVASLTLPVAPVMPWTPDTPNLYDLTLVLEVNGKVVDEVKSYFAMREISLGKGEDGITRMMLNGKFLFQHGPLDQGWWPDGLYTAPTDEALRYDVEMTKNFGYNTLRKHVKTEPARFYYHCDKLGMLVWQDMPSGDRYIGPNDPDYTRTPESAACYEKEWSEIVAALYNSPCIVAWVPFNEGWGQFDTTRILDWTKELDPTRLVDGPSGWSDRGSGDMHDAHIYRGPGMFPPSEKRATVLGEYGGLGLPVAGHTWVVSDANWGYGGNLKDAEDLVNTYADLNSRLHPLIAEGLSAAIYTQTTDVEVEVNGLMTYDRIPKFDVAAFKKINDALHYAAPTMKVLVPTAREQAAKWRYTTDKPADGWESAGFDTSSWKEGESGFGTERTPNTTVRTTWDNSDIWMQRTFELTDDDVSNAAQLRLNVYHDEDCEIFVNGVLVASPRGYVTDYVAVSMNDAAKAVRPGNNVISIHCHQTGGGQFIDAGVVRIFPAVETGEKVW